MSYSTIARTAYRLRGLHCRYALTFPNDDEIILVLGENRRSFVSSHSDGNFELKIQCAWRLEQGNSVLAVCRDYSPQPDWGAERGLRAIYSQRISDVLVSPPAWDLTIQFEGGLVLHAFCDSSIYNGPGISWTMSGPAGFLIAVGPKGDWTTDETQANWGEASRP